MKDVEFLALLVHRGRLGREEAQRLVPALKGGAPLDELLGRAKGWTPEQVAELRRSRCGEIPEIPGYRIAGRLGTGGTADVFRAIEEKSRRTLALKVLKPEATLHAPTRKAFIAEARLLERLTHPGLVKGLGVARAGNLFFARMEFLDGHTVLEELEERGGLPEGEALEVALATAEVLGYLQAEGVVHRDVKPGNIMRTKDGRTVLIDLGFAAAEDAASDAESAVGTVAYLSPEQACGGASADTRSDIYSLGISLFHITLGKLPFASSDDREVLRMQVMETLCSPELKSRGISPHLHYFIEKMVAKEAGHRYQSWAELIADVRAQVDGRADLDLGRPGRRRSRR